MTIRAQARNKLATHPSYPKILAKYNELFCKHGHVNNGKFYREYILPEIPDYHIQSWYQFLRRAFKKEAGLEEAVVGDAYDAYKKALNKPIGKEVVERALSENITLSDEATARGIRLALNVGTAALQKLMENPEKLLMKEAIELLFKAMKAQDSRARVIKEVRQDVREEEKFNKMLNEEIYGS